jgi:flagellar L-ring protein precursor FlgH
MMTDVESKKADEGVWEIFRRLGAFRADDLRRREGAFRGRLRLLVDLLVPLILLPSLLLLLAVLFGAVGGLEAQTVAPLGKANGVGTTGSVPVVVSAGTANAGTGGPVLVAVSTPAPGTPMILGPASAGATISVPSGAGAKKSLAQKIGILGPGNLAASSLGSYLTRVRAEMDTTVPADGSIWTNTGRLTRMTTDDRAMRPNDLIQVVVEENLAASTDGTVKNQRSSTATSQVSALIGVLHAGNALQNLLNQSSANSLQAQGASAVNSSLTTTFGGQVIEVLPNGMLVIEAARQVEFSQQTQTIVLRGLVRPEDISQQNQVLSTAISSLELEVKGKGIVNDYTRRQNPLVRFLQQILVF